MSAQTAKQLTDAYGFVIQNQYYDSASDTYKVISDVDAGQATAMQGAQGTGASYDPPTGGSGLFGWLSGIFKTITDISAKLPASLGERISATSLGVTLPYGSTAVLEAAQGRSHNFRLSAAAVAGQFGRVQLANPVGSGGTIVINGLTTWGGTAGTHTYSAYEIPIANVGTVINNADTCYKIGGAVCAAIPYYANSASAIPTTGLVAGLSHTAITAVGTSITYTAGTITIPEGKCVEIAIGTANVAMFANVSTYFLPNA